MYIYVFIISGYGVVYILYVYPHSPLVEMTAQNLRLFDSVSCSGLWLKHQPYHHYHHLPI